MDTIIEILYFICLVQLTQNIKHKNGNYEKGTKNQIEADSDQQRQI